MRRSLWLLVLAVSALAAVAGAPAAQALPANPWAGQWRIPVANIPCAGTLGVTTDQIFTATQSGSRVTFTYAYAGHTGHITGDVSPDNTVFTAGAAPDGWTEDPPTYCFGTGHASVQLVMAPDAQSFSTVPGAASLTDFGNPVDLPGTRATALPALCPGADGPWTGQWRFATAGGGVATLVQRGQTVTGSYDLGLNGEPGGTLTGSISGSGTTLAGTWAEPSGSGTFTIAIDPGGRSLTGTTTPTGRAPVSWRADFAGCAGSSPAAPNLAATIPSPQTVGNGPTTIVAPGTISLASLRRSKCVLVRVATRAPARILVTIYSGRRSVRLFGQQLVRFAVPGRRDVCIPVPLRAHTFNVRTPLNVALGYALGPRRTPGERKQPVVTRPIRLRP